MAGRWTDDDRERDYWRRERRYDVFGRDDERDRERWRAGEERSFDRERGRRDYRAEDDRRRGEDWQDRDYGGVSPAMRRGAYETGYRGRFQTQDYTRGGRDYGDDGRAPIYRAEYGQGGFDYGPAPRGYDEGRRFLTREADERWEREMRRPHIGTSFSGGTGGYDYERGYGDGGRESGYGAADFQGRSYRDADYERGDERGRGRSDFEDRARDAGEFFRRTGRRISSWFAGEGPAYGEDERRWREHRGARGLGPKGYQRSDERISEDAHQRLTDDPWLDASGIDISVAGGEVTLGGTVETREAKHRAERIVEDLSGVKHVQNNLRIQPGGYFTRAGRGYGDSVQEAQLRNEPLKGAAGGNGEGTAKRT